MLLFWYAENYSRCNTKTKEKKNNKTVLSLKNPMSKDFYLQLIIPLHKTF